ncbi:MAG: hypothetical protein ACFFAJ_11755, partial [Candidatus Hodarchaeota archaeon]
MIKKQLIAFLLLTIFLFLSAGRVNASLTEDKPDFVKVGDHSLEIGEKNEVNFNITVKNNGEPATTGFVPIMWETKYYEIRLYDGKGILEESEVDYDLNGDNDKSDTFDVTWFYSDGRLWDAKINDNGDEVHAYSICEGPPDDPWSIRRYYFNGQPKFFKLGTETHFLYIATDEGYYPAFPSFAAFGLCKGILVKHPSPNFELFIDSDKVKVSDFYINGKAVDVNYTVTVTSQELYYNDYVPYPQTVYVINNPDPTFEIDSGEEVSFSCIFKAQENTTCRVFLLMNWSPDGNLRYRPWAVFWDNEISFTKYSDNSVPGFSFLPILL